MKKEKPGKEVTIKGFVAADEWDDRDNVVGIAISTDDEDYRVELNKTGEELFDFLDEDVEVTGMLREDRDGNKSIRVTSYELLEEEEYEDEEGYLGDEDYDDSDLDDDDEN
jgi:hypothetical protein